MKEKYEKARARTFREIFLIYAAIYVCLGFYSVNMKEIILNLIGATEAWMAIILACHFSVLIFSTLLFGYYGEKLAEKYSRKKIFIVTNLIWVISYGMITFSVNQINFLILIIAGAIGIGAFIPLGFSMIGDFYPPKQRGDKYGQMQIGLLIGSGGGIIFGGLLGGYAGINGWRYAYGLGAILGLAAVIGYSLRGINPQRGREEPEFKDFKGKISYNYRITLKKLKELFRSKTIIVIIVYVLLSGIATTTLGNWWNLYLTEYKFNDDFLITVIYLLSGLGAIPGSFIGGRLGDKYFRRGKLRRRVLVSLIGLFPGVLLWLAFYKLPFYQETALQIVLSTIFFILIGFIGYMLSSFPVGNQFAIYSEVSVPEARGTANALNWMMVNFGGIIGNLIISSFIDTNIALLPVAVTTVLLIWFFGSFLWIIVFFTYPKEAKKQSDILMQRRQELENSIN
ncbi:MAG: MFS transporter [Candidatus Lokiarchaeota archaeon]|nr:MFS transporter [Candidatus Lokiarchaeota archaeon]